MNSVLAHEKHIEAPPTIRERGSPERGEGKEWLQTLDEERIKDSRMALDMATGVDRDVHAIVGRSAAFDDPKRMSNLQMSR